MSAVDASAWRWLRTPQWCSGTSMAIVPGLDLDLDTAGVLGRAGVWDGHPFVLGADGSYDIALNRFFQELDGWEVRSANTAGM
jgi:hypothetical protein